MNPENILQVVTLATVGWALSEIISLKTKIAAISQKINDLPCGPCEIPVRKNHD